MTASTFAEQAIALDAMAVLRASFGHLPAAHVEASPIFPGQVSVHLHGNDGHSHFEAWREAMGIPVGAVEFQVGDTGASLTASGPFAGATVWLRSYGPVLPVESPAEDAHLRECQLVEQHHQIDDPAEPDPAEYIAVLPLDKSPLAVSS